MTATKESVSEIVGETVDQIASDYDLPQGALQEAIDLSANALIERE